MYILFLFWSCSFCFVFGFRALSAPRIFFISSELLFPVRLFRVGGFLQWLVVLGHLFTFQSEASKSWLEAVWISGSASLWGGQVVTLGDPCFGILSLSWVGHFASRRLPVLSCWGGMVRQHSGMWAGEGSWETPMDWLELNPFIFFLIPTWPLAELEVPVGSGSPQCLPRMSALALLWEEWVVVGTGGEDTRTHQGQTVLYSHFQTAVFSPTCTPTFREVPGASSPEPSGNPHYSCSASSRLPFSQTLGCQLLVLCEGVATHRPFFIF